MRRQLLNGVVNRIRLVGIELEGGWDKQVRGHEIIRDGSVKFERAKQEYWVNPETLRKEVRNVNPDKPYPAYGMGEIVSTAMDVSAVDSWMDLAYPPHVNDTCGLHVHMSFYNKLNYSRLMTPEYMDQMVKELQVWGKAYGIQEKHPFWNRLNPDHHWTLQHCAHVFLADNQARVKKKDYNSRNTAHSRYTFINYCEGQHSTVECRGLPMFEDVKTAKAAVMCVIDTTNRFLSKLRQRERGVKGTVQHRPASFEEIGTVVL